MTTLNARPEAITFDAQRSALIFSATTLILGVTLWLGVLPLVSVLAFPFILAIEAGTPGVSLGAREPTLGLRAVDIRTVSFAGVRIGSESILGRINEGWPIIVRAFDRVRVILAAAVRL